MHRTTPLLLAVQRDWPVARRLSLLVRSTPPAWVAAAAQRQAGVLTPGERVRYQANSSDLIAQLSRLRRQWRGTLLLAVLLSIAVIARAVQAPMDAPGMAIFGVTLYAILLPALAFKIGITYDLVAATALQQALRAVRAGSPPEQRTSGGARANEVLAVAPVRVEQEIDRID